MYGLIDQANNAVKPIRTPAPTYLVEVPQGWRVAGARPARAWVRVVSGAVRSPVLGTGIVAFSVPCIYPIPTGPGTIPGGPRSPFSVN